MYQTNQHAASGQHAHAAAFGSPDRPPSKINEMYWELVDFIFPLMRQGDKAKEIARLANRVGLRTRKGKRLNAAYIDSQIYYYKMREHQSLAGVYRAYEEQRQAKAKERMAKEAARAAQTPPPTPPPKPAEPKQWSPDRLIRLVLDSDLHLNLKIERIDAINAGRITQPISVTARVEGETLTIEMVDITDGAKARLFNLNAADAFMLSQVPHDIRNFSQSLGGE